MYRASALSLALVVMLAGGALASWNPSGSPVCTAPGFQGELLGVTRPAGGYCYGCGYDYQFSLFALWSDARDTVASGSNLYFRDIALGGPDPPEDGAPAVIAPGFQGYAAACFTGIPPSDVIINAGVIVAWSDNRNGLLDVYARRLLDVFNAPWPADGVPVCTASGAQNNLRIVGDLDAGATISWLDPRAGFNAIYAQRLDADGAPQWTANGIPICDVSGYRYQHGLAAAPDGGAYFVWIDDQGGPLRVHAVRFLPAGTRAPGWPANGFVVSNLSSFGLGPVLPDGAGGLYVTFYSAGGQPVACRVDGGGAVHAGWPADGVLLAATAADGAIEDASVYEEGLVVLWRKNVNPPEWKVESFDLVAQRLLPNGTRAAGWGAEGNVVCDAPNDQGGARLSGGDAIVATWEDSRDFSNGPDVYALRMWENGTPDPRWPANGLLLAGGFGRQFSPRPVWDGLGGVLVAWVDDHDFDSFETDVYAQRVSLGGVIGTTGVPERSPAVFRLDAPVPNPARGSVTLGLGRAAPGPISAAVQDVLGRRVRVLAAGGTALRWDLTDDAGRRVEPGVYWVSVRSAEGAATRAVVVRR